MSVLCECINVVVPVEVLERRYWGGLAAYQASVPNQTFCCDGTLTRVGFMDPAETQAWADAVEAHGVQLLDDDGAFADMAVLEVPFGPTRPCPWLELGQVDGLLVTWLAGSPAGDVAVPAAWSRPERGSTRQRPAEQPDEVPVARVYGADVPVDPQSGERP